MLVFNVIFKCRPGQRAAFLHAITTEGIDAAARAENGNLAYEFYIPVDSDTDLLLIEKYLNADAVAEHVRQAHTMRLVELKEAYVSDMLLEKYDSRGN